MKASVTSSLLVRQLFANGLAIQTSQTSDVGSCICVSFISSFSDPWKQRTQIASAPLHSYSDTLLLFGLQNNQHSLWMTPSTPSSLLHNIHFLRSDHQPPHITLVINRPVCSSGDVCADSLACLLTPSRGDSEPLSVSIMSHVQKQERLMSFCITSSPLGPDTQCVCVCASACLRERVPHSHRCVWWCVFSLHACVCLCVKQCSSWGAACCSSPYLEADLICCSTAAPDTWKSHD